MSRLIETIRVAEGKMENLEYHFRRMKDLHTNDVLKISIPSQGIHKLRIVYDINDFEFTISPYTIKPIRSLKLVTGNNIVYDQKFEDRSAIEQLLALKANCDDILIIKNNRITDVSFANITFREGSQWYTPESFLLNGTMRQKLLDTGMIKERKITVDDIGRYSHFRLINAMLTGKAPESEVSNIR